MALSLPSLRGAAAGAISSGSGPGAGPNLMATSNLPGFSHGGILVISPRCFSEAARVIDAVRQHHTVLVNSSWLEDSPGQRLIDYVCGGMTAMGGQIHRIAEEIFLFAPAGVRVNGSAGYGLMA
jgi:cell division inhibitor SepF